MNVTKPPITLFKFVTNVLFKLHKNVSIFFSVKPLIFLSVCYLFLKIYRTAGEMQTMFSFSYKWQDFDNCFSRIISDTDPGLNPNGNKPKEKEIVK